MIQNMHGKTSKQNRQNTLNYLHVKTRTYIPPKTYHKTYDMYHVIPCKEIKVQTTYQTHQIHQRRQNEYETKQKYEPKIPTHTTCLPKHNTKSMSIPFIPKQTNNLQNNKQYTTYYPTYKQPMANHENTNFPQTACHIPKTSLPLTTASPYNLPIVNNQHTRPVHTTYHIPPISEKNTETTPSTKILHKTPILSSKDSKITPQPHFSRTSDNKQEQDQEPKQVQLKKQKKPRRKTRKSPRTR